jgi:hypothetical protein
LDWSEVNLMERHIEIKASKAKTAARRLTPITDNLAAWLTIFAKPSGIKGSVPSILLELELILFVRFNF